MFYKNNEDSSIIEVLDLKDNFIVCLYEDGRSSIKFITLDRFNETHTKIEDEEIVKDFVRVDPLMKENVMKILNSLKNEVDEKIENPNGLDYQRHIEFIRRQDYFNSLTEDEINEEIKKLRD